MSSWSSGGANDRRLRIRSARAGRRPADVRPHRPRLRRDEPDDDGRPRPALAANHRGGRRDARRRGPGCLLRHGRPRDCRCAPRRARDRPRFLRTDARARPAQSARVGMDPRRCSCHAVRGRELRHRDRGVRRAERGRPRGRAVGVPSRVASGRAPGNPGDHETARTARALLPVLVRRSCTAAWQSSSGWICVHLSSCERASVPGAGGVGRADRGRRIPRREHPALRRWDRRAAHGRRGMTALAEIREAPGLDAYLSELEDRLEQAGAAYRGVVAEVGAEALAAGGKRLRPLLVYLSTPPGEEPPVLAGVTVELIHLATLMHDDLIDGARLRRGHASAWSAHGPEAARTAGDYLFARAFAELTATGDARAVAILANATLCLARGEALQRSQRFDPDTTVDAYLERCTLKTGKLFEAACRLAGGSGAFGLALGVAFQITDDILDCSGVTIETGKIAGTDLREGTPTLPLLLAAQRDEAVRAALAGGSQLEGALLRVASTGAIEESREVALAYARNARACLNGELHREELESLTYAVVDRER